MHGHDTINLHINKWVSKDCVYVGKQKFYYFSSVNENRM